MGKRYRYNSQLEVSFIRVSENLVHYANNSIPIDFNNKYKLDKILKHSLCLTLILDINKGAGVYILQI